MRHSALKRWNLIAAALLALALAPLSRASADEAPAEAEQSELDQYLETAAINNAGLRSAFEDWQAAVERIPQARSLPDPRFTYEYHIQRMGAERQSFALMQMFPWFGKLRLREEAEADAARAAEQRYEEARRELANRVVTAYTEYYYLARSVDTIRAHKEIVRQVERVARTQYQAGVATHANVIRAQVELGRLEERLQDLLDQRWPAVAELNAAMNEPRDTELPWPQTVPEESLAVDEGEVFALFRDANPRLRAQEHRIAEAEARVGLARRERYPDITVGVEYMDSADRMMDDGIMAMLSINLPIWPGRLRGLEREARARRRSAALQHENLEQDLSARINRVLYQYRDAERKIDLYGGALLPKAREALNATLTAFQAGEATFTDVLDAERVALEFRLALERARADRVESLSGLDMLVGANVPRGEAEGPREEEGNE